MHSSTLGTTWIGQHTTTTKFFLTLFSSYVNEVAPLVWPLPFEVCQPIIAGKSLRVIKAHKPPNHVKVGLL